MSRREPDEPVQRGNLEPGDEAQPVDTTKGYETSDVNILGVAKVMIAFGIFAAVSGLAAYGIGKLINTYIARQDGPQSRWSHTVDLRPLGNMSSNPDMQNKMSKTIQQFPAPRLQTDDGLQDLADLHAREDLLLNNYSWADREHGKVRIPIARAMELIAQRGLPVAPAVNRAPVMTGDKVPQVDIPLTNGFARTGFESDEAQAIAERGRVAERKK
jgi:hypothetical protein